MHKEEDKVVVFSPPWQQGYLKWSWTFTSSACSALVCRECLCVPSWFRKKNGGGATRCCLAVRIRFRDLCIRSVSRGSSELVSSWLSGKTYGWLWYRLARLWVVGSYGTRFIFYGWGHLYICIERILYPVLLCSLPKSCLLPSFVLVVKYIASESNWIIFFLSLDFLVKDSLPNVTFPVPRSFAGNVAVNRENHANDTLFFWAFETQNGSLTAAADERSDVPWAIWLNGGWVTK